MKLFLLSVLAIGVSVSWAGRASAPAAPTVAVLRVPDGGIQPQIVQKDDVLHLLSFTGDPARGDLAYVRSRDYGRTFSKPVRVNSQPGSAMALGNIRGGQMAVGGDGRVDVAWIGSATAQPRRASNSGPVLYAGLNDAGTAFEPERSVNQSSWGADGATIAADSHDNVYVFWHAQPPQGKDEAERRLWMAKSGNGGKTFAPEAVAFHEPTGACGCCGARAYADAAGALYVLFRSATGMVHRDIYLLSSTDHGATFRGADISPWNIGACVMSSEALISSPNGVLAAWESEKQAYFGRVEPGTDKLTSAIGAPGTGDNRKYPTLAVNNRGETLFAWTEDMAWKKGGSAVWQVYDRNFKPGTAKGRATGVPVWGLVAAFARPDSSFVVMY